MPTTIIPTIITRLIVTTLLLLSGFLFSAGAQANHIIAPHTTDDFITKWRIPADDRELTFPGEGSYTIHWGDGMSDSVTDVTGPSGYPTHPYTTGDRDYDIVVVGAITRFSFSGMDAPDYKDKLIDVAQWGDASWTSMEKAFQGASNMEMSASDTPTLTGVMNMSFMFHGATVFNGNTSNNISGNISEWVVSNVTDMTNMFAFANAFNKDISGWDVSKVTSMLRMFDNAHSFNQDISSWDVSSVSSVTGTGMFSMFVAATAFNENQNQNNLGRWYVTARAAEANPMLVAQNAILTAQSKSYRLVMGVGSTNNDLFTLTTAGALSLKEADPTTRPYNLRIGIEGSGTVGVDQFGTANEVAIIVTSTGEPGARLYAIEVPLDGGATDAGQTDASLRILDLSTGTLTAMLPGVDVNGTITFTVNVDNDVVSLTVTPTTSQMSATVTVGTNSVISGATSGPITLEEGVTAINIKVTAPDDTTKQSYTILVTRAFSDDKFVTKWKMPMSDLELTFPGTGAGYSINWGDGIIELLRGVTRHTYAAAGDYTVVVSDAITGFNLNNGDDKEKLIDVAQWGDAAWSSDGLVGAFRGASALRTMSAMDTPDLTIVTDMSSMFRGAIVFDGDINNWVVSNVANMSLMFADASAFNQDLNSWIVSSVMNMNSMFFSTLGNTFNGDISLWNVSSVTDMSNMFSGARNFDRDIGDWDVSSVTLMSSMFNGAAAFDQDINRWDVSKVTLMFSMFNGATDFNQDISNWDVSKVTNMQFMFVAAPTFMQNLGRWYVTARAASATPTLVAQNDKLDEQNPAYTFVDGIGDTDNDSFMLDAVTGVLSLKEADPTTRTYSLRISVSGAGTLGRDRFGTDNEVAIIVTSTGEPDARLYAIEVPLDGGATDADPTDATLSGLSLSTGALDPMFASDIFEYTATVSNATDMITLTTLDTNEPTATFVISGTAADGTTLLTVNADTREVSGLTEGANTITIVVTAADGMPKQTYTVTVTRVPVLALTAPANQVYLAGIEISLILPPATGGDGSYTYTLTSSTGNLNGLSFDSDSRTLSGTPAAIAALATLTYTVMDSIAASASVTLTIGVNTYDSTASTVDATSATEGGVTKITLGQSANSDIQATGGTITLPSGLSGATITVLAEVSADLLPADPDGTVPNSRRSLVDIDVTDVSNGNLVTICLPYGDIANPALYHATGSNADAMWNLLSDQQVGNTLVCGNTDSFSLFAAFGNAPAPTATLDTLTLTLSDGVTLAPIFDSGTFTYTASVMNSVDSLRVTPTTSQMSATVTVGTNSVISGTTSGPITLEEGVTAINIVVTAGVLPPQTYTILVTRAYDMDKFVTEWKMPMSDLELTFPGTGAGAGYSINWGDGNAHSDPSHTYATAGDYTVVVSDAITGFSLNNHGDAGKLIDVAQWGDAAWSSEGLVGAFRGASALRTMSAMDTPDLTIVTDMSLMFADTNAFNQDLNSWIVSSVMNMDSMFFSTLGNTFNGDISLWNVSSVTDMSNMFSGARNFDRDIGDWDVSSVTLMGSMFNAAAAFDQDITRWDVSKVTLMFSMFNGARDFNRDISNWDVSKVTNMQVMFGGATAFNQNLGRWYVTARTASATPMLVAQNMRLIDQTKTYDRVMGDGDTHNSLFTLTTAGVLSLTEADPETNTYNLRISITGAPFGDDNEVAIIVTSTGEPDARLYAIEVPLDDGATDADATDATLSDLMLSAGTLSPGFDSAIFEYTATVSNATDMITLTTLDTNEPTATFVISGTAADGTTLLTVNADTREVSGLTEGANTITIVVTAADGMPKQTYTVTVTRVPVLALTAPADQVYVAGTVITFELPEATGGDGNYTYTLMDGSNDYASPVNGLTFTPSTRTLSGTPAAMAAEVTLTYAVVDSIRESTPATFTITVLNTYVSSTVDATSATEGDVTKITLGQSANSDIQATGGIITLPSGLSGATITVATLAVDSATLPADPDGTAPNSRRSLVDIAVTGVSGTNPVTICLPHGGIAEPGLYHATGTDLAWGLLPSQQVGNTLVCGTTTAFSPFAVFGMQGLDAVAEAQVLNAVLPQLLRATTKITVDNISNRIDQAFASSPADTASLNLGGSSSLEQLINNNLRSAALKNAPNLKQMLNNSSFLIPLNVAGDNNYGVNSMTLWGSGDYLSLADNASNVDWKGEVTGASVGIDTRLNKNLVAGAALSYSKGDVDYNRGTTNIKGTLTNTLSSIHPYFGYDLPQGGRVWGALGYGQGEVEINEQSTTSKRDTDLRSLAFGGNRNLSSSDNWLGRPGTTTLRLKGEVSLSNIEVDRSTLANAVALSIDAHRYRVALEGSHKQTLANGASISPSVELGIRFDDGSGETGGGLELAGSYRYSNPKGLEMEIRAHGLLAHESSYKEWGLSGLVKYQANSGGRGLRLSLQPAWGDTPGNVADRIWQPSAVTDASDEDNSSDRRLQLNTEIGYGLPGLFGRGLLTPYAGLNLANGKQTYNLGGRWAIDSAMNLSLISEHKQTENSILLRGDFKF